MVDTFFLRLFILVLTGLNHSPQAELCILFHSYDRINYADQNANNVLASKVGSNSGSLWSNIATVNYPSGLSGPVGM